MIQCNIDAASGIYHLELCVKPKESDMDINGIVIFAE